MIQSFLQNLGFHIYRVPHFHERAVIATDLSSVFLREGLADSEERGLLIAAVDVLLSSPRSTPASESA